MRSSLIKPVKDKQTVHRDGTPVGHRIDGLIVQPRPLLGDRRGEIIEVYNPAWKLSRIPLVYVYYVVVRPGAIRGWVVHKKQDDRLFMSSGVLRWVFFDDRPKSPTYRTLNQIVSGERNRMLVILPAGVYHAVQNIGTTEATFINMPTRPYRHEDPDKYRLPIKNDLIPFDFNEGPGW